MRRERLRQLDRLFNECDDPRSIHRPHDRLGRQLLLQDLSRQRGAGQELTETVMQVPPDPTPLALACIQELSPQLPLGHLFGQGDRAEPHAYLEVSVPRASA